LQEDSYTEVLVFDIHGRRVKILEQSYLSKGNNKITWNARDTKGNTLPNGVYLIKIIAADHIKSYKVIINN